MDAVVAAWAADVSEGHKSAMYSWGRIDVAELNRQAGGVRSLGRLHGPGRTPMRLGTGW